MAQKRKKSARKTTARSGGGKNGARRRKRGRSLGARALLGLMKLGVLLALVIGIYVLHDLPAADDVKPVDSNPSITILAHDGSLLARYGGLTGSLVTVDDVPPHLIQAVMAIEDRRFYSHFGIDVFGMARAMWVNVRAGRWVQGGSTITQQLAKNLFLTPDKTLRRKIQEAVLALRIEWNFSKDEIMAAYLNRVYFGAGAYGVDSAARTYFNKSARDLGLWESAVLAGLLKAPSRFSPTSDPDLSARRAHVVLRAMLDENYIDADAFDGARQNTTVMVVGGSAGDIDRYFTDWVINQIDSFVANNDRDLIIRTTFDPRLQRIAAEKQAEIFAQTGADDKITQAAIVTLGMDGAVLAMVGGRDYAKSQFNRAAQAVRQPGSAFKPFVFLAAMEAGFQPDDPVEDAPIDTGSYRPENYNDKYYGTVTLTDALALSLNTATIRILADIGVARLLDVVKRLGFIRRFKPELATGLGASETDLLELTNAYAVIANGGHAVWPYGVLSIEDSAGNTLYQYVSVDHARLFARRDILALDQMLVQVVARGTGQAAQLSRGHVAGKTGTSQNYRDAWFVGYTDRLVTGVWMGNDDNTPMRRVTGGGYPARLWKQYMEQAINVNVPAFQNRFSGVSAPAPGFSDMLKRWSGAMDTVRDRPAYNN